MHHRVSLTIALSFAPCAHGAVDGLRDETGMVVLMVALLIPPVAVAGLVLWLFSLLRSKRLVVNTVTAEAGRGLERRRSSVSVSLGRLHVWGAATLFFFAVSPVITLGAMHRFERTAFINLFCALLSGALGIAYRTRLTHFNAGFGLLLVLSTGAALAAFGAVLFIGVWSWRDLVAPLALTMPLAYCAATHGRT